MRRRTDPTKGVAYLRVSREEQKLGPEAQRQQVEEWAARGGVHVVSWHVDRGVSGGASLDERPALLEALAAIRQHRAGVLVVAKRDRIARDVYVAATFERAVGLAGARVTCADGIGNGDSPVEVFMRGILDATAAFERSLIRARTKAALAAKRAKGERTGEIPFGFRLAPDGKRIEIEPREQLVIERVRALRAAGLSMRKIAGASMVEGLSSRSGRPLSKTQVERILASSSRSAA